MNETGGLVLLVVLVAIPVVWALLNLRDRRTTEPGRHAAHDGSELSGGDLEMSWDGGDSDGGGGDGGGGGD